MRIDLLHYSYPPVAGGVEEVMSQHAALFRRAGHEVEILCGWGEGEGVTALPQLRTDFPPAVVARAARNEDPKQFTHAVAEISETLRKLLSRADTVFLHNVLHMHFHLPLTTALWQLADEVSQARFVSWIHDLAAVNPDYRLGDVTQPPWSRLTEAHPRIEYVAVSPWRAQQFARLTGGQPCDAIPNGIDPVEFLRLTPNVAALAHTGCLFERELVTFHPARLVRRKNIEFGLRVTAALATRGRDVVHVVTAAADPHNAEAAGYLAELRSLARTLGVADRVFWVSDYFTVTKADLFSLYSLADVALYPSRQEGFGLPLLETALERLPVLASRIEPMTDLLPERATIDPCREPEEVAEKLEQEVMNLIELKIRKRVLQEYRWDVIYASRIKPLLDSARHGDRRPLH